MLAKYILLALLSLKGVMSDLRSVTLSLYSESSDYFVSEYKEFDNVQYVLYTPKKGYKLNGVVDRSQKLWDGNETYDSAKFVLCAFDNGVPTVLYVYTELFHYYDFFFTNVNGKWVKTTLSEFTKKVNLLKLNAEPQEFTLNLDSTSSTEKFNLEPTTNFKKFDTFTPKVGYSATSVYHNVSLLWSANNFGERAVMAWAFKYDDTHYLVRLLVVNAFGHFRFFNFFRVKDRWVDAESEAFSFVKADDTKYPQDFYYPQYFLASSNRLFFMKSPQLPAKKSELLSPAFDFKRQNTKEDYDFKYHNAAIPYKDCHKLDFSKRVSNKFTFTRDGMLDKVLPVKTFYPKFGKFFGNVVDGNVVLYRRNVDSEACVGVHFYSKDKKFYLADVLVTSPHNPRSEYHVKEGNRWVSINKAAFLELMEKLKA